MRAGSWLLTLALCGCAQSAHTVGSAGGARAEPEQIALSSEECGAAYARLWTAIPPCTINECGALGVLVQQTIPSAADQARRDRSCTALHSRAWYDCAMQAPTVKAWLACPALAPRFQSLEGEGPFVLGLRSEYVSSPDLLRLKSIAGERATVLVTDTQTGEQYEAVLATGDRLDLSRERPADPEPELPPGFDDGMNGGVVEPAPAPAATWKRLGARFKVAAITSEQLVLEPLPRDEPTEQGSWSREREVRSRGR